MNHVLNSEDITQIGSGNDVRTEVSNIREIIPEEYIMRFRKSRSTLLGA